MLGLNRAAECPCTIPELAAAICESDVWRARNCMHLACARCKCFFSKQTAVVWFTLSVQVSTVTLQHHLISSFFTVFCWMRRKMRRHRLYTLLLEISIFS